MNIRQSFIVKFFPFLKAKSSQVYGSDWYALLTRLGDIGANDYYQGLVFSCVDLIAKTASSVPFVLTKKQKDDRSLVLDDDDVIVNSHPILDLLNKPNRLHSWPSFSYLFFSYLSLHNESFLLPIKSLSEENVVELLPLDPTKVLEHKGKTNYDPVTKYTYSNGGVHKDLKPEEVIFTYLPDPYKPERGVSPIEMAKRDIEQEILAKKWNSKFFKNGGSPSGIFKIATSDENAFKQIEKKIKEKYTGIDNAFKMFILNKDSDFKSITPTQRDMDFMKQLEFSEQRIFKTFKVPSILLGDVQDAKYSNADVAKRVFSENVIAPLLYLAYSSLNANLLSRFKDADKYVLKYHNPVPEDKEYLLKKREQDRKEDETSFKYVTINEIREEKGLPAIDGGDRLVDAGIAPDPEDDPETEGEKGMVEKAGPGYRKYKAGKNRFMKKTEKAYTAKLKANYTKFVNAIRDGVIKQVKSTPTDLLMTELYLTNLIPDTSGWRAEMVEIVKFFGNLAIDESIKNSADAFDLSIDFSLVHEEAVRWLTNRSSLVSTEIRETMLNRAREIIARNISQSKTDLEQIKKELIEVFAGEAEWRIDRIVRTELHTAYGNGSYFSYKYAGVKKIQWITGSSPCPGVCQPNKDKIVDLGTEFPNGTKTVPAHPNCKCDIIPVIED